MGTWTIIVRDTKDNEHSGKFIDWHLKLWGESIDPSKAKVLPMPTEEEDDDHAQIPTTTLAATTTSLPPVSTETEAISTASDHIDRPVNAKPTNATTSSPSASPTGSDGAEEDGKKGSTWLPSFLPTLGVSASTQAWIYGALGLIIVFCCGLGVYLYLARRRRLRNGAADDYEFELLDEEEAQGLNSGEKKGVAGGKKGRRTRGGELYDAFAGGSDEEDEDDFGEREYRDRVGEEDLGRGVEMSEKRGRRRGDEEEAEHHVVGDDDEDDEDEEEDGDDRRPLRGGR